MESIENGAANQVVVKVVGSILEVDSAKWDALALHMPLLSHAFLSALEKSDSVRAASGWSPCILTIQQEENLLGAMPLYIKSHSYGEYVFDWAWADAYQQNGLAYYPKLLSAIPFSPVTSARLLAMHQQVKLQLIEAVEAIMHKHQLSSAHVLFPDENDASLLESAGWLKRTGVQFRWLNEEYDTFEGFLKTLSHNKRKKIHQERKKIHDAKVISRYVRGQEATEADWDFFYRCYCATYCDHHSKPYLMRSFFNEIAHSMPQHILLIIAERNGKKIASTLNFFNHETLYGRYWGATEFVSGLHFELCYYQAQQFCIDEKIKYFEGGAQGEHKLARGFKPRSTTSFHKIANPQFELAIRDFLLRETKGIASYTSELEERTPFKSQSSDTHHLIKE